MTPLDAKARIKELKDKLLEYNRQYYKQANPSVSDYTYDSLMRELKTLEEKFPQYKTSDSPTSNVGSDLSKGFKQVKHSKPMMSLDNTYNEDEVTKFILSVKNHCYMRNIDFIVECKIDGLSISCKYRQGHLVQAVTRGNGLVGDDVTQNVLFIDDVPKHIVFPGEVPDIFEIRGEIFMTEDDFKNANELRKNKNLELLSNPRNAAAGTLKSLDTSVFQERRLSALFYDIGEISSSVNINSQEEMFDYFNRCSIPYEAKFIKAHTIEEVVDAIAEIEVYRHTLHYPTDGAVIKINDFDQRKLLGQTSKCPRWAKAYKFAPNQADTIINSISVQVGRSGALTPVAELDPVELDGTVIKRATLHNEDYIKTLDIRIGDRVTIEKAGEIIPAVVSVISHKPESESFDFYKHLGGKCPICGGNIQRVADEAAWKCINPNCRAQLEQAIIHFGCKEALDLQGLGSAVAKALIASNKVKTVEDILDLTQSDFACLDVDGKILGVNGLKLKASIDDAIVNKPLSAWICALGIPLVGKSSAYDLSLKYKDLKDFRYNYKPDGTITSSNISDFLKSEAGNHMLNKLISHGVIANGNAVSQSSLSNKTIVITGVLTHMGRHTAEEQAKRAGAKVASAVSRSTDYLVLGKSDTVSTKEKKARELGIPIITEDEFLLLLK